MTSPAEFEAALSQLETSPPEIQVINENIREERWTHFSLEGAKFPTVTIDVVKRGEALATFETLSADFKSVAPVCPSIVGRSETCS